MWSRPVPWLPPMIGPWVNSIVALPQSIASPRPSIGSQSRCRWYHLTASLAAEVVSCTDTSPAAAGTAVSASRAAAAAAPLRVVASRGLVASA